MALQGVILQGGLECEGKSLSTLPWRLKINGNSWWCLPTRTWPQQLIYIPWSVSLWEKARISMLGISCRLVVWINRETQAHTEFSISLVNTVLNLICMYQLTVYIVLSGIICAHSSCHYARIVYFYSLVIITYSI